MLNMTNSLLAFSTILIFTTHKNKSPFFMNLSMILIIFILANWALWGNNKWVFSVIIIFYLGGMMVLFAYIVSLSKSKYVFFNSYLMTWSIIPILMIGFYSFTTTPKQFYFTSYLHTSTQFILLLSMVLIILLIIVNKICISYNGPLSFKQND